MTADDLEDDRADERGGPASTSGSFPGPRLDADPSGPAGAQLPTPGLLPSDVAAVLTDPVRLAALAQAGLDARTDDAFDRFTRLVTRLLDVPVSLVSLVDASRQYFPGMTGLQGPDGPLRETPLSHSFCQYVVATGEQLVVTDAPEHALVCDNLAIPDLGVVGYAGMPLTDEDGQVLGSLCAIDTKPRSWTEVELDTLRDVAASVSAELRLRISLVRLRDKHRDVELTEALQGKARDEHRDARARVRAAAQQEGDAGRDEVAAARRRAEEATERLALLADLGEGLLHCSTSESVYDTLADVLVPRLADSCALHVNDGRAVTQVASAGPESDGPHPWVPSVLRGEKSLIVEGNVLVTALPTAAGVQAALCLQRDAGGFDRHDALAAVDVARRVGLALDNARLLAHQRTVASTLQHGLLRDLPSVAGLQLAARYLPAIGGNDVGGDWYDAFVRADGVTAVVIGDVVGHDLAAATRMGELSTLVRATAYDHADGPAAALERVDAIAEGLGSDLMASVILAYLRPADTGVEILWSAAGHPSPLIIDLDGGTRVLLDAEDARDLMLGVHAAGLSRHDHVSMLATGETLLLYTDGLVERRQEDIDESLGWLRAHIARRSADGEHSVRELADAVLEAATLQGAGDDVAVLAVAAADSGSSARS